jgi:hypothetical protein
MIPPEIEERIKREGAEAVAFIDKWLEDYAEEEAEMRATVDAALEQLAHRIGLDELALAFNDSERTAAIIGRLDAC